MEEIRLLLADMPSWGVSPVGAAKHVEEEDIAKVARRIDELVGILMMIISPR